MLARLLGCVLALVTIWPAVACAQAGFSGAQLNPPVGVTEPVPPISQNDQVGVYTPAGGGFYTIRLGDFASAQDLDSTLAQISALSGQSGALSAQINALSAEMNALSAEIAHSLSGLQSRADQGAALAAAFTIIPPEPGDRFSITASGAEFGGEGAGSVTATCRVAHRILMFGGYARSNSYNMFKAGVSLSFN